MLRFTVLFLMMTLAAFSQYKFEREYKVSPEKVPITAKEFIGTCNFSKKIKWYAEESQSGNSFEAKTYYKKRKHSIEFDATGKLIDTEIKVKFSELPLNVQQHIKKTLSTLFKKYKIEKTQIQYSGSESSIYNAIFNLKTKSKKATINYELIVEGNKENTYSKYEFLFDKNGTFIKKLPFPIENSDNIQF